jgi:hypothetical protein
MDHKKYIRELFEVVSTTDILIVNKDNQLIRLNVPFTVLVVHEVPGLYPGEIAQVTAIKMDMKLIDIYIIGRKAYYYYNFVLFTLDIYPDSHSMPGLPKPG